MARQRVLHPNFFVDEKIVQVSAFARLMFQGLWCLADREGRLERKPLKLKMQLFPADSVDGEALVGELEAIDLVRRYDVDGASYLWIPGFKKHQHVHPKEVASRLPEPQSPGSKAMHEEKARAFGHATPGEPGKSGHEPGGSRAGSSGTSGPSGPSKNPSPDKRAPKPKKPVDPRYGPLVGRLKALTLEHAKTDAFTNADGAALKTLIGRGELDEEIITRFTRGLTADRYSPKCATVMQLLQRWPELGIVRAAGPPSRADPNDDIVRSTGEPCVICGSRDTAGAGNIFACYAAHLAPASAEADRLVPSMPWLADLRPWVESMRGAP